MIERMVKWKEEKEDYGYFIRSQHKRDVERDLEQLEALAKNDKAGYWKQILEEATYVSKREEKKKDHDQCDVCREYFDVKELFVLIDGLFLCKGCFENEGSLCDNCGATIRVTQAMTDNVGNYYCNSCWEKY